MTETPFTFPCEGETLVGILHKPEQPASRGVLIVVGGPQTRVGSHRQFVLLARDVAAAGIPVMRFDYRGMGDSGGDVVSFEEAQPDIERAVDEFFGRCKGLQEVVLWGLCDAASAVAFYAHSDPRVSGLVLLNPWVRSVEGAARAYLRHYYGARLFSLDFWRKVIRGEWDMVASAMAFVSDLAASIKRANNVDVPSSGDDFNKGHLSDRMLYGLERFKGRVLVVLSGDDLTAAEFRDTVSASRRWQKMFKLASFARRDLPEANHTYSRRVWRDQVAEWTREWVISW